MPDPNDLAAYNEIRQRLAYSGGKLPAAEQIALLNQMRAYQKRLGLAASLQPVPAPPAAPAPEPQAPPPAPPPVAPVQTYAPGERFIPIEQRAQLAPMPVDPATLQGVPIAPMPIDPNRLPRR